MSTKKSPKDPRVRVAFDPGSNELHVRWGPPIGWMEETSNRNVLERLDDNDNTLGFIVQNVTKLKEEFEVFLGAPRGPARVPVKVAAEKLGVSERRVRQFIAEGRIEGVRKDGRDWMIPAPILVKDAGRGTPGVANKGPASVAALHINGGPSPRPKSKTPAVSAE